MDDYKQLLRDRPELLEALEGGTPVHSPEFSEDWLSLKFAAKYGDTLRYVAEWGQWLEWTGKYWSRESTLKVFDFARSICRQTAATAESQTTKKKLCDGSTVTAVERLSRSDRQLSATSDQWNVDALQINCLSGTIDLQTAKPLSHNAANYHTKIAGTSFSTKRPEMWLDFLERVTAGDKDLQTYLRRVAGYCLSGSTQEHALFFLYGSGANGKSVFTSTLSGVMGDYARATPVETFTEHSGGEQHPCAVAALQGVRLAITQETERGSRWAESKLKQMTGGDRLAARFMHQNFFEFVPQFKIMIAGNHRPRLSSVDEAIRRRMHLIPWAVTIPENERDPRLTEKLKAEWPQILGWAVAGCLEWQSSGLKPPDAVNDATKDYLHSEDKLGLWLEERCIMGRNFEAESRRAFDDYKDWCENVMGEKFGSQRSFSADLMSRPGILKIRNRKGTAFSGIFLKADLPEEESQ